MVELLRKDQKVENTWDLESMFKTNDDFWNQFKEVEKLIPEIKNYRGKVKEGAKGLLEVFKAEEDMSLKMEQLTIYAFLRKDQDSTDAEYGELYAKTMNLSSKFYAEWSFLKPELLSIEEDVLLGYVEELDELKVYKFELEKLNKKRPHTLDAEQEKIIAMAGEALNASDETFSALNNADVEFEQVEDKDGNKHTLTHGTYGTYMESTDRVLRKNTFHALYD